MRIIIGNGKVAQRIKRSGDVVLSHSDIEIRDESLQLVKVLTKAAGNVVPEAVINTAALIDLDYCETHKEECYAVNTIGAVNIAKACDALGWKLVHISSGCVFDGMGSSKAYTEEDDPTPASFYAVSKAEADRMLLNSDFSIPILILRPRQLVSAVPNKTNMLTKFLAVPQPARFITSPNSITCLENFAEMIDHLLVINAIGVYNCANEGTISPYEIAEKLTKLNPELNPQPIEYQKYLDSIKVKRVNTVLNIDKLKASGYHPRTAAAVIDWCVENYGKTS